MRVKTLDIEAKDAFYRWDAKHQSIGYSDRDINIIFEYKALLENIINNRIRNGTTQFS